MELKPFAILKENIFLYYIEAYCGELSEVPYQKKQQFCRPAVWSESCWLPAPESPWALSSSVQGVGFRALGFGPRVSGL